MPNETGPPIAAHHDHVVIFGKVEGEDRGPNPMNPPRKRNDPLFWLRDDSRKDPAVLAHLEREKAYFEQRTHDIQDLANEIYDEHISHIQETDMSAPYKNGPYYYYTREVEGKSYKIHCRVAVGKQPGNAEDEEVLIDVNALADGKPFCDVHDIAVAPPLHDRMAYSVDWSGNEVYSIELRSLSPQSTVVGDGAASEVVEGTNGAIVWDNNGSSLFYTTKDDALRDDKVWRHILGQPQSADVCVYHDPDPLFNVYVSKSLDGQTIILGSESSETSEVWLLNLTRGPADNTVELVRARAKGVRYEVQMHGTDTLVILTNDNGAVNHKLVLANRTTPSHWGRDLVSHSDDVLIEGCTVLRDFIVISTRREGLTRVCTMLHSSNAQPGRSNDAADNTSPDDATQGSGGGFDVSTMREMEMGDEVYSVSVLSSQMCEYDAQSFRIVYSSLATPHVWSDVDPVTHAQTEVKRREVGGGYHGDDYLVARRYAVAPDHTRIPISLVYHRSLNMTTPQPCMLYGYGSYGISMNPSFALSYIPYVERGMIYAMAHIRGGSEMGRAWYEVGAKYLTKRNTFSDFIAAAEFLIESGLTTPARLSCEGRSAGGLLMGAVLNMRPDLFKAAIAGVPFVDVMTTMCDPSIPLTTGEWEEWGNPNEYKYYDYMLSYSPMDNIRAQDYPAIMVQAGLHDPRVAYWEPAKWVSKLREYKTDSNEVLFKIDLESGHFSAKDRYKYWRDSSIQQAFVCKHLGATARLTAK